MKRVSKIAFLMIFVLSLSISAVYADTGKKEEKSEEEIWISEYATDENSSKGTVIENVDKDGKPIDVEKEELIDVRQFISFKTKSGKTLHLIIDHSKNNKNVRLLTEVSELDLLNMLEDDEKEKLLKEDTKETVKKEEPKKEEEIPKEPKEEKTEKTEDEKSSNSLYLIFGLFIVIFVGAGYYFKVYKKKSDDFEDDEDYDELETDEYENVINDDFDIVDDDMEVDDSEEDEDE